MPFGRPNNVSVAGSGIGSGGGYNSAASIAAGSPSANKYQGAMSLQGGIAMVPIALVAFIALYVIWAVVEQHERVREVISPSNVALNLRNFFMIGLTAILSIVFLKVFMTKAVAIGIPGAATLNQIVAAA